jgi:hypothetical protein
VSLPPMVLPNLRPTDWTTLRKGTVRSTDSAAGAASEADHAEEANPLILVEASARVAVVDTILNSSADAVDVEASEVDAVAVGRHPS